MSRDMGTGTNRDKSGQIGTRIDPEGGTNRDNGNGRIPPKGIPRFVPLGDVAVVHRLGDVFKRPDETSLQCILIQPYVRKDGIEAHIYTWEGKCVDCGEPFAVTSGRGFGAKTLHTKRCRAHRWVFGTPKKG